MSSDDANTWYSDKIGKFYLILSHAHMHTKMLMHPYYERLYMIVIIIIYI